MNTSSKQECKEPMRMSSPTKWMPALAIIIAILASCGDENAPLSPSSSGDYKGSETVYQEQAPIAKATSVTQRLNNLRSETFGTPVDVKHRNVPYTAAYRHAVYLNTANSKTSSDPLPTNTFDEASVGADLVGEPVLPTGTDPFPALVTHDSLYGRIQAVVGSKNLISSLAANSQDVWEMYVVNGDIYGSIYRGFNLDTRSNADPSMYAFNDIESLWYIRQGRALLSRPSLTYIGYGRPSDGGITPPYPLFDNRLVGVLVGMYSRPAVAQLGYWPREGSDVTPYGLDKDYVGPTNYVGPPIHISLPVNEPLLRDKGVVKLDFRRSDGTPPQVPSLQWRKFLVFSNVENLNVPVNFTSDSPFDDNDPETRGEYRAFGSPSPLISDATVVSFSPDLGYYRIQLDGSTDFAGVAFLDTIIIKNGDAQIASLTILGVDSATKSVWVYAEPDQVDAITAVVASAKADIISATGSGVKAETDSFLKNGELMIMPLAPLEPNATYKVTMHLRTASYSTGELSWEFTTNSNSAPY